MDGGAHWAIEVAGLEKRYGDRRAVDGISLAHRRRRGLRPARPQRRGQDDDRRDARGLPRARRRHRPRARPRPAGATARRCAPASASCSRRVASTRACARSRRSGSSPRSTTDPDDPERLLDLVGLRDGRGHLRPAALGRGVPAPVARARARSAGPRCCSSTSRPRAWTPGPAPTTWELVRDLARRRHHRRPDHARHGRGRAALRPGRDHRPRPDRHRGQPGRHHERRRRGPPLLDRPPGLDLPALAAALSLAADTVAERRPGEYTHPRRDDARARRRPRGLAAGQGLRAHRAAHRAGDARRGVPRSSPARRSA